MAKRKPPGGGTKGSRSERRRENRELEEMAAVVTQTAELFSCSTDLATELATVCEQQRQQTRVDLTQAQLALSIWGPHEASSQEAAALTTVLRDLETERQRQQDALRELRDRLAEIAARATHEHLDDPGHLELIVQRLIEMAAEELEEEGAFDDEDDEDDEDENDDDEAPKR